MFPYVFMPVINLWRWMVTGRTTCGQEGLL